MEKSDFLDSIAAYIYKLRKTLNNIDQKEINSFVNVLINAYHNEKHIFVMGNGGSSATASHFACDINKGVGLGLKKRFKVICLNDNIATIMAYSNDLSYDDIFVEQLKNFFQPGDVVICFSGSGNSKNVLNAVEFANLNDGITVGFTGYDGGKLRGISKYTVNAKVGDMQISEDIHMAVVHMAMQLLEQKIK